MKPRPLVLIEWEDACQHNMGMSDEPLASCLSAGYAWRKGNAIALCWHPQETEWPENSTSGFAIPIGCVQNIYRLNVGRKMKPTSIPEAED